MRRLGLAYIGNGIAENKGMMSIAALPAPQNHFRFEKMQTKITGRSSVFHSVSTQNPALPNIAETGAFIPGEGSFAVIPSPLFGKKTANHSILFQKK